MATLGIHIRNSGYVHDSDVNTVSRYSDRLAGDKLDKIIGRYYVRHTESLRLEARRPVRTVEGAGVEAPRRAVGYLVFLPSGVLVKALMEILWVSLPSAVTLIGIPYSMS